MNMYSDLIRSNTSLGNVSAAARSVSIVIALYNEQQSVRELFSEIACLVDSLNALEINSEVILVDDKSTDRTAEIVKQHIAERNEQLTLVTLRSNTGQVMALSLGLSLSSGQYVLVSDGDLQFPLSEAVSMIQSAFEGNDLICSVRKNNALGFLRAFSSNFFGFIARYGVGFPLSEVGCNFRVISRSLLQRCADGNGFVRYSIMTLAQNAKFVSQKEITVRPRKFGSSTYDFYRLAEFYLDLITDSKKLVINGIILSLLFSILFFLLYVVVRIFCDVQGNYITAPAQIFMLFYLSLIGLVNIFCMHKLCRMISKIGYPVVDEIIG